MKKVLYYVVAFLFMLTSCQEVEIEPTASAFQHPQITGNYDAEYAKSIVYPEINVAPLGAQAALSKASLEDNMTQHGFTDGHFNWDQLSDLEFWSAAKASGGRIAIGFSPVGTTKEAPGEYISLYQRPRDFVQARTYVLEYIRRQTEKAGLAANVSVDDLKVNFEKNLAVLWLTTENYEVLAHLRKLPNVRYAYPFDYELMGIYQRSHSTANQRTQSTCGGQNSYNGETSDTSPLYTIFNPTVNNSLTKVSWHLSAANVDRAWLTSRGAGITIGLLDTGISPNQRLLNEAFRMGYSSVRSPMDSRYIEDTTYHIYDDEDVCGHGTTMAGQMVGPVLGLNNTNNDGIAGVAYQADLISYKVGNNVHLNSQEKILTFTKGLEALADNSSVKIITIAMGRLFGDLLLKDCISYAHAQEKLMFCAAGSVVGIDLYPARYSKVYAVTAVEYHENQNPVNDGLSTTFHNAQGLYVDFAAFIRNGDDGHWGLGMLMDVSTPRKVVGSSGSTAMLSGIAALVWSAKPCMTRQDVVDILIESSTFGDNRSLTVGHGVVDAEKAVQLASSFNCNGAGIDPDDDNDCPPTIQCPIDGNPPN